MPARTLVLAIAWVGIGVVLLPGLAAHAQQNGPAARTARDAARVQQLESNVTALRGKVDSMRQTNQQLTRQLSQVVPRIDQLEKQLAALTRKLPTQGSERTKADAKAAGDTRKAAADWMRFRDDVLKVVEPELAPLRALLDHRHTHEDRFTTGGWAKRNALANCPDCLIRFTSDSTPKPAPSPSWTSQPK